MLDKDLFKLPIMYCEDLQVLSKNVIDDLELDEILQKNVFKTENLFAMKTSREWCKHITSNIKFLEDTQHVINNMKEFKKLPVTEFLRVSEVWNDVKIRDNFMERYNYFDFHECVLPLNESPLCLQVFSSLGLFYPIVSLLIPIITLLVTFVILKIKKVSITFDVFLHVLCKHTFSALKPENVIYGIIYAGIYVFGVYSNVKASQEIYNNIQIVNKNLFDFKTYLNTSITKMELFIELNKRTSYKSFCDDVEKNLLIIKELSNKISFVTPFEMTLKTTRDIGPLLTSYYELKHNPHYDKSLRFLLGFDGYLDNLSCLYDHIYCGRLTQATYESGSKISFIAKEQIYPHHSCLPDVTTNDVDLKRNMIITGPNASGKTTYIKMTAINIILSQQIGCGYYKNCYITPFTNIHSYINIPDTSERDSLFQAESRRCKSIIDAIDDSPISSKHFCIFDELYTGTTPESSSKASYSFLAYICKRNNVKFLMTTHYKDVCKKLKKMNNIKNFKMDVVETHDGISYSYKIVKGISNIDGAVHVLNEMNYPSEIVQTFLKSS